MSSADPPQEPSGGERAPDQRQRFARVAAEFRALLGAAADARAARLAALQAEDAELAHEVQSLLEHATDSAGFLATPVVLAPQGARIGRYLILEQIGEGGMGAVFRAQQLEPVQRVVALKLIKLGMDTRAVVQRFESERQVLAQMEHPGIARILDGGVAPDGRPYFVMELVPGVPITTWCNERQLSADQRVELFLQVCAAVQHAHQKGVIHRDLKPSNLLVTEVDGKPLVKVIDFGIARALDEDGSAAATLLTSDATAKPGTPEYMSPEQAQPGAGVDIRSDVYSLGVVLYELLVGSTPARTRTRHGSVRTPAAAKPALRGNLNAMVLKAISPEQARRYGTVAALAEDLERHLQRLPVRARPAGAWYVGTQFARRHTLLLSAAACVLVALVGGLVLALSAWQQARQELFLSTVARGRLAGAVGDVAEARTTLWGCYLEQPESPNAAWALRELYTRYPCVWTMQRTSSRASLVRALNADTVVMLAPTSAPFTARVEDGQVLMQCAPAPADGLVRVAHHLAIAPDGSMVAVSDGRGDVRAWNLRTGAYLGTMASHGTGVADVAFLGDAQHMITAGADGRVLLVNWKEPERAELLWQAAGKLRSVAAHAATGQLAAGQTDGTLLLWQDTALPPMQLREHKELIMCMAFDPTGTQLATGSTDARTVVWSVPDGAVQQVIPSKNGTVRDLAYDQDGSLYILGWWQLDQLKPGAEAPETVTAEGGWRMAVPRAGDVIVTSADEHVVRRWRTDPQSLFEPVAAEQGWSVRGVAGGPDAVLLTARGRVLRAQAADGQARWSFTLPAAVSAAGASEDGSVVAAGLSNGQVWLRSAAGQWQQVATDFGTGTRHLVQLNPAGTLVAYATRSNAVMLLDLAGVRPAGGNAPAAALAPAALPAPVQALPAPVQALPSSPNAQLALHFTRDGHWLAATERKDALRLFHLQTSERRQHDCGQTVFAMDSTPAGQLLLGTWTGPLLVAQPDLGVISRLRGHTAMVAGVALVPGEPALALTSSADGTVRLWHLERQCELQSLAPFAGEAAGALYCAGTLERVVVAGPKGRAVSWPLRLADQSIQGNTPVRTGPGAASPDTTSVLTGTDPTLPAAGPDRSRPPGRPD